MQFNNIQDHINEGSVDESVGSGGRGSIQSDSSLHPSPVSCSRD